MLTGKCNDKFWEWFLLPEILRAHNLSAMYKFSKDNGVRVWFLSLPELCQHALMIDFFDENEIWKMAFGMEYVRFKQNKFNWNDAVKIGVEKANEIYNSKH